MEGILVNGPINAVRLQGNIFGIEKIIYLFMDIHSDLSTQTQCKSFESIDFVQYLVKMLKVTDKNKIFDLFAEISGTAIASPDYPHRGRYKDEINRYLKHELKSEKKINTNIRIHYIDIRDFLKNNINIAIYNIHNIIKNISLTKFISKLDFENLYNQIKYLQNDINIIYTIIFSKQSQQNSLSSKHLYTKFQYTNSKISNISKLSKNTINIEVIKKFINKITNRYNHRELIEQFQHIFFKIENTFRQIFSLLNQSLDLMNKYRSSLLKPNDTLILHDYSVIQLYGYGRDLMVFLDFIYNIQKMILQIDILCVTNFAMIVDLFFLRRFLDKDYITHAIVYTGAMHSIFYIYNLIKYFGFKITNFSYSSIANLNEIENIIKNSDFNPEIEKIFLPEVFSQCINMTHFPSGFE